MEDRRIVEVLKLQYGKALNLMQKAVEQFDTALWLDGDNYGDPAWRIAYHGLFYTNLYLAPTAADLVPWPGEKKEQQRLKGGRDSLREAPAADEPYTREEILQFISHIRVLLEGYLDDFRPEQDCWPDWYDENRMEFHLNNLRHLQHHIGALVERHDGKTNLDVGWQ